MKYIRTKDNILDYEKEIKGIKFYRKNTAWIRKNVYYWIKKDIKELDKSILKQADTIKELCDVIVCGNELLYPLTSNREGNEFDLEEINRIRKSVCMSEEEYNKIKETTNDFEPYFWNVYGAIWTDKGLIYVAKMNDKGELELL